MTWIKPNKLCWPSIRSKPSSAWDLNYVEYSGLAQLRLGRKWDFQSGLSSGSERMKCSTWTQLNPFGPMLKHVVSFKHILNNFDRHSKFSPTILTNSNLFFTMFNIFTQIVEMELTLLCSVINSKYVTGSAWVQ